MVKALLLDEIGDQVQATFAEVSENDLPDGDVTVRVEYSTLNYKDAMILKGIGRLVRNFPHIPGVDFSGIVEHSESADFKKGDRVVLNGARVGETRWGGYATKAKVKSEWLVRLPSSISNEEAMGIGTAGFSAMLAIMALEEHGLVPQKDTEVLVTGAAGGVGSIAVSILANLGYNVAACTGRQEVHAYLKDLGAQKILERESLLTPSKGPLGSQLWAGAIDNVGGEILANLLTSLSYGSSCAAVGMAASSTLKTTVIPFLLRGINLLGIDSVTCSSARRIEAWKRIYKDFPFSKLPNIVNVVPFTELIHWVDKLLEGEVRGRIVVKIDN